ncbi:hypothetical protein HC341_06550 [Aquisalimonas sp. 2447]|uniref:hypothetical protein n=1 Tax=Aquisalimonas sp. 2447 TaxID=2740807 RepID=UPI0014325910|nr:hypothetical protein [Aquisalimonas sp. 2447]QIT54905.1 hypothetical protein HC341_06550 [Aquisalimonas sp. 2447]
MYERKHQPLLPTREFLRRLGRHLIGAIAVLLISLGPGVIGFGVLGGHDWDQAFANAVLMLGGLGPLDLPETSGGRFFVGLFGFYSGLVFAAFLGILILPIIHRLLHHFHLNEQGPPNAQLPHNAT